MPVNNRQMESISMVNTSMPHRAAATPLSIRRNLGARHPAVYPPFGHWPGQTRSRQGRAVPARRVLPARLGWSGEAARSGLSRGGAMPYCTIVEFGWDDSFGREQFAGMTSGMTQTPEGCLSRIVGSDDSGARIIEVWRSGDDARAFAEQTAPDLASGQWPMPSRVLGFEASYIVA